MNPAIRLRRLAADYENMLRLSRESERITFEASGRPPDTYIVTYRCRGLFKRGGSLLLSERHQTEFILHAEYPLYPPHLRQLTPIYHPNFHGESICINERNWAPSESLSDLVLHIGNMIVYRNYNPNSALNAEAAVWANNNRRLFPLDRRGWTINSNEIVRIVGEDEDIWGAGLDLEMLPDGDGASPEPEIEIRIL